MVCTNQKPAISCEENPAMPRPLPRARESVALFSSRIPISRREIIINLSLALICRQTADVGDESGMILLPLRFQHAIGSVRAARRHCEIDDGRFERRRKEISDIT